MKTKLFEVSLKLRAVDTKTEHSYYEVWRIRETLYQAGWTPQLAQVVKRAELPFKPPSPSDIWQVLLETPTHAKTEKDLFELGKHLIKEYILDLDPNWKFMVKSDDK